MEKKNITEELSDIFCGATGCALPENTSELTAESANTVTGSPGQPETVPVETGNQ